MFRPVEDSGGKLQSNQFLNRLLQVNRFTVAALAWTTFLQRLVNARRILDYSVSMWRLFGLPSNWCVEWQNSGWCARKKCNTQGLMHQGIFKTSNSKKVNFSVKNTKHTIHGFILSRPFRLHCLTNGNQTCFLPFWHIKNINNSACVRQQCSLQRLTCSFSPSKQTKKNSSQSWRVYEFQSTVTCGANCCHLKLVIQEMK